MQESGFSVCFQGRKFCHGAELPPPPLTQLRVKALPAFRPQWVCGRLCRAGVTFLPPPIADPGQVNEGTSGLQCHKDGCRHLHGAGGVPRDGSRTVVVAEEMPTTKKKHNATSVLFFIPSLNSHERDKYSLIPIFL